MQRLVANFPESLWKRRRRKAVDKGFKRVFPSVTNRLEGERDLAQSAASG